MNDIQIHVYPNFTAMIISTIGGEYDDWGAVALYLLCFNNICITQISRMNAKLS